MLGVRGGQGPHPRGTLTLSAQQPTLSLATLDPPSPSSPRPPSAPKPTPPDPHMVPPKPWAPTPAPKPTAPEAPRGDAQAPQHPWTTPPTCCTPTSSSRSSWSVPPGPTCPWTPQQPPQLPHDSPTIPTGSSVPLRSLKCPLHPQTFLNSPMPLQITALASLSPPTAPQPHHVQPPTSLPPSSRS